MTDTHPVPDAQAHTDAVAEYRRAGYSVVDEGERATELRRRDHGSLLAHIVVFFTLGFWTLGLANACYAWYRRRQADRVRVVVE